METIELLGISATAVLTGTLLLFTPLWGHSFVAGPTLNPPRPCSWPPSRFECIGLGLYLAIAAIACAIYDVPSYYGSLELRTESSFFGFAISYWWMGRRLIARQRIDAPKVVLAVFVFWQPAASMVTSAIFFGSFFLLSAILAALESLLAFPVVALLVGLVVSFEVWLFRRLRFLLHSWSGE
ncbi:hypothetical protein [Allorhodopirellula solitaria]|uniref:Uncharacterized protein n=1 Tax=Allorhodopirellula solitaria TaxID=2527987 RepID=A0A5C5X1A4_9BACT|nr:hypothetical protein [Allorhodopirellula solitaria]TWT56648.1 hypothetical protein CA85_41820 [Allorhodopirellula solitaria]